MKAGNKKSFGTGKVAQLVESLPSVGNAPGFDLRRTKLNVAL